jgi:Fe-S-cluster-containing hydrogenase component 2
MDALTLENEKSTPNYDRCIGCGVCVPTCPEDALLLEKKKETVLPPQSTGDMYKKIMQKKAELRRQEN